MEPHGEKTMDSLCLLEVSGGDINKLGDRNCLGHFGLFAVVLDRFGNVNLIRSLPYRWDSKFFLTLYFLRIIITSMDL